MKVRVSSPIIETPRVMQIRGMFDLPEERTSTVEWEVSLPLSEREWNIGLIVGPSGCGKSTIASHFWGRDDQRGAVGNESPPGSNSTRSPAAPHWPSDQSILDAFPEDMPVKEVAELLSSVGFSSPPAWLRPFQVLSTGQQFRVTLARLIAEAMAPAPIVFDEYTSVVDRTVAQIGSAAVAKIIRKKNLQFVAITCHEDVEEWLQPDWVYRPAENAFSWRLLRQRPAITLEIFRCHRQAWDLFAPHHYLSSKIHTSACCFLATWKGRPVAFSSWLNFVAPGPSTKREHRTVALPDFQGVGIGNALSDTIASMWTALGHRAISTTTHPAMIRSRAKSPNWTLRRPPSLVMQSGSIKHASNRLTAGFAYVGPPMNKIKAKALHA